MGVFTYDKNRRRFPGASALQHAGWVLSMHAKCLKLLRCHSCPPGSLSPESLTRNFELDNNLIGNSGTGVVIIALYLMEMNSSGFFGRQ